MNNLDILKSYCENLILETESDNEISIFKNVIRQIEKMEEESSFEEFCAQKEFFTNLLGERIREYCFIKKEEKRLDYNGTKIINANDTLDRYFYNNRFDEDQIIFRDYEIEINFEISSCGYSSNYSFSVPTELITTKDIKKYFEDLRNRIIENNKLLEKKLEQNTLELNKSKEDKELEQLFSLAKKYNKSIGE